MRRPPIPYSDAEIAWLRTRASWPRAKLHARFCRAWQRTDVSLEALERLCKRKRILTGRSGRFSTTHQPPDKGKQSRPSPRNAATRFKPGARPHNRQGPGHERLDKQTGYIILIIDEANPWSGASTRPVQKHRHLWELANGPVPEGHVLKSLDGNKTNTDPANWSPIPRALLPRLNGRFGRGYDSAPPELQPTILAVTQLELAARERRRGGAA